MADGSESLKLLTENDPVDRYGALEDISVKAQAEKVISPLPENEEESIEFPTGRLATIRDRLHLLGYLPSSNGGDEWDNELKAALKNFQEEANLSVDGWAGKQTWQALQELVGFDTPNDPQRWFKEPGQAALRAAQRRLHALDLSERQPKPASPVLDKRALRKFSEVSKLLDLSEAPLSGLADMDTLTLLFDQDGLVRRLAAGVVGYKARIPDGMSESLARKRVKEFMVSVARVELWLLGYPLSPGRSKMDKSYLNAMRAFWIDQGFSVTKAEKQAKSLDSSFFTRLLEIEQLSNEQPDEDASEELDYYLDNCSDEEVTGVWNSVKSLGARLWDGLKRAWNWFKTKLVNAVKKTVQFFANIGRLVYRYALKGLDILKTAFKAMTDAVKFFFSRPIPGSDVKALYLERDRDWDLKVWVNQNAPITRIDEQVSDIQKKSRLFGIGAKVLKAMVSILLTLLKSPIRGGWFGFILGLYKMFKQVRSVVGLTSQYKELLYATI